MKITVITPVYNGEKYIDRCVTSVVNQTYNDWEMYIIDDGSTDKTADLLEKYKQDVRFHLIRKENEGAGQARNYGLELISNPESYVVFLDSDDYLKENYFEILSQHNEDLVFIDVAQTDDTGQVAKKEIISVYRNYSKDSILRKQLTGCIPWGGVRKAVRGSVILENGIRFSDVKIGEEALYSFKAVYHAKTIGFIDECVYYYFQRQESLSSTFNENPWQEVFKNLKNYIVSDNLYESYADSLNAFAVSSCAVSLKRISVYGFKEFKNKAKTLKNTLNDEIDKNYSIDKNSLCCKARIVHCLLSCNFYWIIYLMGKLTYKRR